MSNTVTDEQELELVWLRTDVTLLNEALDASETGVDVDDGSLFAIGDVFVVDTEQFLVTDIATNTLTVTRGYNSTTAATHAENTSVGLFIHRRVKLTQPIQPQAVDRFPGKITIGDYSRDSNDILSSWIVSDLTGGHGIADLKEGVEDNRYRFGTLYTRYPSQWSKPYSISATTLGAGSVFLLGDMDYNGTTYRMAASDAELYQNTTDLGALTGAPSEKGVSYGGTASKAYFYIPQGNNGYSTYDPSGPTITNTAGAEKIQAFLLWDEKLLAIDNAGVIYYATTGAAVTTFTAYTLGGNNVRIDKAFEPKRMHQFYNQAGDPVPYVVTNRNVWVFEPDTPRFRAVPNFESVHPRFGLASCVWRGELFVATGLDILAYNGSVLRNIGLSRDDGLPYLYQGYVRDLVPSQNSLFAFVRGVTTGGVTYNSVHEWSGFGWHCIYRGSDSSVPVRAAVSAAGSAYKLHWGLSGTELFTQVIPETFTNPREAIENAGIIMGDGTVTSVIDGFTYETQTYYLESGRFDANMRGYRKIANALELNVRSIATGYESIKVYYRLDSTTAWTQVGSTITASGIHTLPLGHLDPLGNYTGIDFEVFEWRVEVIDQIPSPYVQSTSTVIESMTLSFLKLMNPSLAWTATVDFRTAYHDASPETMADELTELRTLPRFFSLKHRDRDYRGRLTGHSGSEEAGDDTRSVYQLSLIEIPQVMGVAA